MKTRTLGDLTVSAIGIGCMPMAGVTKGMYGEADESESIATIRAAIDRGVTFFRSGRAHV